jgi:hypothetical protein
MTKTKGIAFIVSLSIIGMPLFSVSRMCAQTIYTRSARPVSVNTTLTGEFDIVLASGGPPPGIQITLPLVATGSNNFRQHFTIKKVDNTAGPVTIVSNPLDPAAANIDGQTSFSLVDLNQEVRLVSDGANWNVVSAVPKNVVNADTFPGANASAKIITARDSCPNTGCVIDARGLQGAQTISQTITLGLPNGGGKPVQLLLGAATFTTTACPAFELKGESTILEGLSEGNYNGTSSLTTLQVAAGGCSGASGPLVRISIDAGVRGGTIRRLRIDGQRQQTNTVTAGIEIFASQTFRNTIEDVTIGNVATGILVGNDVSSHRINRVVIAQVGTGLDFGQGNMRDMVVSNSTISGDVQAFVVGSTGGTISDISDAVAFTNCDMTASPNVTSPSRPNWIGLVRNVGGFHIAGGWYEFEDPPVAVSPGGLSRNNNVVTVTTTQPHKLTAANVG